MTTTTADIVRRFMPWSHSKISLAEKCPKAFEKKYVHHSASRDGTEARVGTATHAYLEHRLDSVDADDAHAKAQKAVKAMTTTELETLKERNSQAEAYIARASAFRDKSLVAVEGLEVKLAIEPNGTPCDYEDKNALIRGSVDHLIEQWDKKALVIDHKSGRTHPIHHYAHQLNTYQVLTLQNRPHLTHTQAGVHHIQNGGLIWQHSSTKVHVQKVLLPWLVRRIENAAAGLAGYPAKVTPLCAWCDYHAHCEEGIALISVEDAERKRNKKSNTTPRLKKDGTPYAKREKKEPFVHERPEEMESAADLFPDDMIVL